MRIPALCLTMVLALGPSVARSQATPSSSPVTINSCGPMLNSSNTQNVLGIPLTSTSEGIQIQFTNDSGKTANLVNFAVQSNGESFVIRDVGTFSPGIEITHKYRNGEGQAFVLPQFVSPKITCSVKSVHFADGTIWRQGQGTATAAATQAGGSSNPLSISPANVQMDANSEGHLFMVSSSDKVAAFSERSTCNGIATITLSATGESAATYTVKPIAAGSCMATIQDEAGHTATVPITVH